ncbi:MAG: flagellar motor protein MotB [Candidatus Liberibacter europaeus]|uniref:Flagellar motor protein MotB n=1 Tax=Candidatus Liberibacter europaeus TaxID=744859 RepID=A0A2T4VXY0_9HYPH|nr:flagellar motor protein MotB [Candidatus Liberibacter europaeus]PTL86631.1 MAG: flagellar motor protein MotB [Candidatus Liberibacter europaeus]
MNHTEDNNQNKIKYIIVRKKVRPDNSRNFHTWKIAYADFMTALMSFFLAMWITHALDDESKIAIESYFNPFGMSNLLMFPEGIYDDVKIANNSSNNHDKNKIDKTIAGKIASYKTRVSSPNYEKDNRNILINNTKTNTSILNHPDQRVDYKNPFMPNITRKEEINSFPRINFSKNDSSLGHVNDIILDSSKDKINASENNKIENDFHLPIDKEDFFQLKREKRMQYLKNAIRSKTSGLVDNKILEGISFKPTTKGILISILDQENSPMFERGSSNPLNSTILVIQKIGEALSQGNEKIYIDGHTDAKPFHYSTGDNWKLSLDRAYNAYKILTKAGVNENRILKISGFSNHNLKNLSDPMNASNRRIEILLQD